ncbi:MAG TPA: recombinase family protein [Kiloniellaceae bacterium]|nr:recombinase family protein [Kiloniellaceae bacterium]
MTVNVGYARTSTLDQAAGFEAQVKALKEADCKKIFKEQVSSVAARPQLDAALDRLREGDTLVVTKLDRLARSMKHLGEIVEAVKEKGGHLHILDLDTGTASGELVLNLLASVAQFEREMMLERQREGIAKAKAEGKYKGRKATVRAMAAEVHALKEQGKGPSTIARELGVGRTSIYRILNER